VVPVAEDFLAHSARVQLQLAAAVQLLPGPLLLEPNSVSLQVGKERSYVQVPAR